MSIAPVNTEFRMYDEKLSRFNSTLTENLQKNKNLTSTVLHAPAFGYQSSEQFSAAAATNSIHNIYTHAINVC